MNDILDKYKASEIDRSEMLNVNKQAVRDLSKHVREAFTESNGRPLVYTDMQSHLQSVVDEVVLTGAKGSLGKVEDYMKYLGVEGSISEDGKVNVVTTCEEAFFAENSNKLVFDEIDKAAKENGVTVTGGGYQDIFWGNLISTLAGSVHNITKIKGSSSYNVEDYGIALAEVHGAGLTLEEFDEKIAKPSELSADEIKRQVENGTFAPSYMWNVVGWLADKFRYHITEVSQKCVPQTNVKDIHSTTLGMDVKAGDATGMSAVVVAKTTEGVEIEAECIGKVYDETEFDKNVWTVIGEPDTTVSVERPDTVRLTCADIVNRIPDVINARPGFVPTSEMPDPKYRTESLDKYLK